MTMVLGPLSFMILARNYELEQTDRYDIGFHDAMAKNREMLTQNIEP
jgi:hypothetical protein